ncbi:hypothetical protein EMCRGX_G001410 [Ephydatia muelleri]
MYQKIFSSVTRKIIEDVHTAICDVDFGPWIKFCAHIQGSKELKDELLSSQRLDLWRSGSTMYNRSCREDEDLDVHLSKYIHDSTEYGLYVNTHVSLWLHSRSFDKKPSLVQALGFVIVNEDIHTQFDAFVSSMPLLSQGCYLQCGPLLQYWNTHMRPIPATIVQLFGDEYLFLYYADVDTLCEWVFKAREEFEKHDESAEDTAEHPVESELEEGRKTKRKCTSRKPKLWMKFGEFQLYEADRSILENNQSWLNDNIINAAQTLLKSKYGTPGLQNTVLAAALQGCIVGGEEFVQVLNSGGNHWLTISTIGCPYSTVNIYDSMCCTLPSTTQKQICALLMTHEPNVTLRFINVDKQNNANDCGLYALAFCAALCSGDNPQHITFSNTDMRKHVLHCLMQNEMEPFNGKMLKRKKMVKETQLLEIICTCRSIEDGNMVECDVCKEWFHQGCITVPENVWNTPSTPWMCDSCKDS